MSCGASDVRVFATSLVEPDVPLARKPELLNGVYQMGFNRPSGIQENALPLMMAHP